MRGIDSGLMRILVVDDEVDAAETLSLLLEVSGYTVEYACDGHSAIERASIFCPDVVLLDISMPGMSGFEVAVQLRAIFGARIKVVALSAWSDSELRPHFDEAGFDDRLTKPAKFEEITAAVEKFRARPT